MTNLIKTEAEAATQNAAALSAEQQQAQQQSINPAESQAAANPQPATATAPVAEQTPPKPKVDNTAVDATIQGLLLQVVALQHNKIQQLQQQE